MNSNSLDKNQEVLDEQEQNYIEKEDQNNSDNYQHQEEDPKEEYQSSGENKMIFVKNIPFATTDEQFQEFFSKFGVITKAEIKKRDNGSSMGIGIVEYANIEDKKGAMNASREELNLEGRTLEIKEARPDTGIDSKTIYVGHISEKTDENMLRKFFMDFCPNLKGNFKINVKTSFTNGAPKGYAYIEFENKEDIEQALKANGEKLDGRELEVQMKKPRSGGRPRRGGRFQGNMGYRRGGYIRRGGYDYGGRERERSRERDYNYRDYRDRTRIRERSRSRERSRERERRHDRGDRDRERDRENGRDRENYYRIRNDRDKERERMERNRERPNRERERSDRDRRNMHTDRNQV